MTTHLGFIANEDLATKTDETILLVHDTEEGIIIVEKENKETLVLSEAQFLQLVLEINLQYIGEL